MHRKSWPRIGFWSEEMCSEKPGQKNSLVLDLMPENLRQLEGKFKEEGNNQSLTIDQYSHQQSIGLVDRVSTSYFFPHPSCVPQVKLSAETMNVSARISQRNAQINMNTNNLVVGSTHILLPELPNPLSIVTMRHTYCGDCCGWLLMLCFASSRWE